MFSSHKYPKSPLFVEHKFIQDPNIRNNPHICSSLLNIQNNCTSYINSIFELSRELSWRFLMADETFGFFSPREQSEQATQSYAVAKDGWKGMRDKETRGQSFVKSRPFVSLSRNYSRIHRKLEGFSARRASLFFFFSAFPLCACPKRERILSSRDWHLLLGCWWTSRNWRRETHPASFSAIVLSQG